MFGTYFTNHKTNANSNGNVFVSRRQSNTRDDVNSKEESRCNNDQKQRNTSRKNSQEMIRSNYSSLVVNQQNQQLQATSNNITSTHQSEEKNETLKSSFHNLKQIPNSVKQQQDNTFQSTSGNVGSSMFFQKTNFESKVLQKKMNEGQLLSMQNTKTFTVGNYSTASSNPVHVNKFKTMLEQSSTWRTNSNNQQYFQNGTDRYSNENKDSLEQVSGNQCESQQQNEKENNRYLMSQQSKKNKSNQDQNLITTQQNPFSFVNEQGESNFQVQIKSPSKNIASQLITSPSQFTTDSNIYAADAQNQNHFTMTSSKQKNLQEFLKTEVDKETNKSIGSGENGSAIQKNLNLQYVNDFFYTKKSLSPRKVIKEANQDQSPSQRHQNSERKPIINSPDIKNSKSFENIFNHQSSIQKFASFHQNIQAFTSNQRQTTNSYNCNGSLQNSFQTKNDPSQITNIENKQIHYFAKDQDNYANCASAKKSQSNSLNLAGSIINLKKSKKKCDSQLQNNIHSTQDSEMSLIKMENINLKNQNQVLTMKNETLEKEKKHYKNICTKKQQECEQLNEQINQLKQQLDQMKVQAKLTSNSEESTPVQKIKQQVQPFSHNIRSLDTPRQLTNITSNYQNSLSPHFQRGNQSFASQSNQAILMMSQQSIKNSSNNNFIINLKSQYQVQQNSQLSGPFQCQPQQQEQQNQQLQKQQQQQQNYQVQPQQQINILEQQLKQTQKEQFLQKQNDVQQLNLKNIKYQQPIFESEQFSHSINTQSPQKNNSSHQSQSKQQQGLSPIVNYEERSDFVSNSILEEIPTTQYQVRTINNSLVQNSNVNDEFEIIQNEYIQDSQKIDNLFINIQRPQNMKF